jgi:hypothetical protein
LLEEWEQKGASRSQEAIPIAQEANIANAMPMNLRLLVAGDQSN